MNDSYRSWALVEKTVQSFTIVNTQSGDYIQ